MFIGKTKADVIEDELTSLEGSVEKNFKPLLEETRQKFSEVLANNSELNGVISKLKSTFENTLNRLFHLYHYDRSVMHFPEVNAHKEIETIFETLEMQNINGDEEKRAFMFTERNMQILRFKK
jgi:hypothetical protein